MSTLHPTWSSLILSESQRFHLCNCVTDVFSTTWRVRHRNFWGILRNACAPDISEKSHLSTFRISYRE